MKIGGNSVKIIKDDLLKYLDKIALAYWAMDENLKYDLKKKYITF